MTPGGAAAPGAPDVVEVWRIPLGGDDAPADLADLVGVLDAEERSRAALAAREELRRRFVIAHGATRHVLGRRLGTAPGALRFSRGPWGKPEVADAPGLRVSLTHSGDLALLAVTGSGRAVGVDVESLRPDGDGLRLARRFFPAAERDLVTGGDAGRVFTRLWTRKEACVKAAGGRLTQGFAVPVGHGTGREAEEHTEPVTVRGPDSGLPGPWTLRDLVMPDPGYSAAIALDGEGPFRTRLRVWRAAAQTDQYAGGIP
ncbi:4'-phosphopantetheinyl transferase superfamily protein [Streptomyces sp. A1499]|nr:4'-phosphopantetheinyl transferase superfamily protein [Streptomyces sp. A1499]